MDGQHWGRFWVWATLTLLLVGSTCRAAETRGVITKVDPARKELVVDSKGVLAAAGTILTFELPADATVQIGLVAPQAGNLKSLAAGQRVRVIYEQRNGKRIVQAVRIVALLSPPTEPTPTTPATPPPDGKSNVAVGTLRYIGWTDRDIVLAHAGPGGREAYTPITVPESARITRDKQAIRFEDLKEEERVAVQFEMKDGKRLAVTIQAGTSADLPMPAPMQGQPAANQRSARLKNTLQQLGQFVEQAGQGKGPVVMDPRTAMKLRKLLAAGEQGIDAIQQQQGDNPDRLAALRQAVQVGMKLTAEIATGNAPKELDIDLDPKLAASLNKVLVIADQVLYFVEQERAAMASGR